MVQMQRHLREQFAKVSHRMGQGITRLRMRGCHRQFAIQSIAVIVPNAFEVFNVMQDAIDKRQQGEISIGKGPVVFRGPNMNPVVTERLLATCQGQSIPFQLSAIGRATPNDANVLQIARAGVAVGLVSIPNRYMHSAVEVISLEDIDNAAELLANFAAGLTGDEDFTP